MKLASRQSFGINWIPVLLVNQIITVVLASRSVAVTTEHAITIRPDCASNGFCPYGTEFPRRQSLASGHIVTNSDNNDFSHGVAANAAETNPFVLAKNGTAGDGTSYSSVRSPSASRPSSSDSAKSRARRISRKVGSPTNHDNSRRANDVRANQQQHQPQSSSSSYKKHSTRVFLEKPVVFLSHSENYVVDTDLSSGADASPKLKPNNTGKNNSDQANYYRKKGTTAQQQQWQTSEPGDVAKSPSVYPSFAQLSPLLNQYQTSSTSERNRFSQTPPSDSVLTSKNNFRSQPSSGAYSAETVAAKPQQAAATTNNLGVDDRFGGQPKRDQPAEEFLKTESSSNPVLWNQQFPVVSTAEIVNNGLLLPADGPNSWPKVPTDRVRTTTYSPPKKAVAHQSSYVRNTWNKFTAGPQTPANYLLPPAASSSSDGSLLHQNRTTGAANTNNLNRGNTKFKHTLSEITDDRGFPLVDSGVLKSSTTTTTDRIPASNDKQTIDQTSRTNWNAVYSSSSTPPLAPDRRVFDYSDDENEIEPYMNLDLTYINKPKKQRQEAQNSTATKLSVEQASDNQLKRFDSDNRYTGNYNYFGAADYTNSIYPNGRTNAKPNEPSAGWQPKREDHQNQNSAKTEIQDYFTRAEMKNRSSETASPASTGVYASTARTTTGGPASTARTTTVGPASAGFTNGKKTSSQSKKPSKPFTLDFAESSYYSDVPTKEELLLQQQNGVAGKDYPTYSRPTVLGRKFSCRGLEGYFADKTTRCQVFYICSGDSAGEPMLCPNGTLFSQELLVCDWWYNVDC